MVPKIPLPVVEKPSVLCSALVVDDSSTNSIGASVVVVVVEVVVVVLVVDGIVGFGVGFAVVVVDVVVEVLVLLCVVVVLGAGLSVVLVGFGLGGRVLITDDGRSGLGIIEVMLFIISLILVETDIMVLVMGGDDVVKTTNKNN